MAFCQSLDEQALSIHEGPDLTSHAITASSLALARDTSTYLERRRAENAVSRTYAGPPKKRAEAKTTALETIDRREERIPLNRIRSPQQSSPSRQRSLSRGPSCTRQLSRSPSRARQLSRSPSRGRSPSNPLRRIEQRHGQLEIPEFPDCPQFPTPDASPERARRDLQICESSPPRRARKGERQSVSAGNAETRMERVHHDSAVEMAQNLERETLKRLDTPRTKEACLQLGIRPEDLQARSLKSFQLVGDSIDRVRIRFNHYERKRQDLLKKVLSQRGKVMSEKFTQGRHVGHERISSLHFMEELLDKEAKKLEKNLRSQVRVQHVMDQENEWFQQKTQAVKDRLEYRKERTVVKSKLDEERSKQVRLESGMKKSKIEENRTNIEKNEETRHATYLAQLFEEEVRLMEFARERDAMIKEKFEVKSDEHQKRLEQIHQQEEAEIEERARELETRLQEKSEILQRRKAEDDRDRETRSEEHNLRVMDAIDRKQQLARQQEFKREEVAKQLTNQEVRIETLSSLKEQIVEARKFRIKQSVVANAKARAQRNFKSETPGPAAYNIHAELDKRGPKISQGNTKIIEPTSLDAIVDRAKAIPAVGCYDPKVLPSGAKIEGEAKQGTIGQSKRFSNDKEKAAHQIPGPGTYTVDAAIKPSQTGAKIVRDYIAASDIPSWVPQTDTPGPAAYLLDPFLRHQRIMKQQKSLPTLAAAEVPKSFKAPV